MRSVCRANELRLAGTAISEDFSRLAAAKKANAAGTGNERSRRATKFRPKLNEFRALFHGSNTNTMKMPNKTGRVNKAGDGGAEKEEGRKMKRTPTAASAAHQHDESAGRSSAEEHVCGDDELLPQRPRRRCVRENWKATQHDRNGETRNIAFQCGPGAASEWNVIRRTGSFRVRLFEDDRKSVTSRSLAIA